MEGLVPQLKHLPGDRVAEVEACIAACRERIAIGHGPSMQRVLDQLPEVPVDAVQLDRDTVAVSGPIAPAQSAQLRALLEQAMPWRKGPFQLFDQFIDAEWRSNLKWDRIAPAISPLKDRRILDIGCGNGYYLFRMAAGNPQLVLGIDPSVKVYYQFEIIQRYARVEQVHLLPTGLEGFPILAGYFDTVFSLGVLYHRKSPIDFLRELQAFIAPGGELVLETLTLDAEGDLVLSPNGRYAKMNNCYFIPTPECLVHWLERCGYSDVRVVSTTPTTPGEQRKTEWIQTESLADFLDPGDATKTIEGYPGPERTIVVATLSG